MTAQPPVGAWTGPPRGGLLDPAHIVILAGVSAALHMAKLLPALPVIQRELGLSLVQAGFLLSTVQLAGMSLGLVIGLASDRLGARRSLLAGLALLFMASALVKYAQSAPLLLAFRAIEGLGFLLVSAPAPGLIRRLVAPGRLGHALGLWSSYMPFATALALLAGPFIILLAGWKMLWMVLALLSLLMGLAVWHWVPPDPPRPGAVQQQAIPELAQGDGLWPRLRLTLCSPGPWLVALCFAVYSGQWLAVIGFLPTLYAQAGVAAGTAAVLTALAAGINILGNVMAGRLLAAGRSAPGLLYGGYTVMGFMAVLAYADLSAWLDGPTLALVRYVAILFFSMVGGIIPGTLFALGVRLAPSEGTVATTVGWMLQWSSLGQFVGPPLVAWVASLAGGWQWTWGVTASFALVGLALARKVARLTG